MNSPPPPSTPPFSSCPGGHPVRGGISPRKIILALVLAASILVFFLVLFAGVIAILMEAAPRTMSHAHFLVAIKHAVAHQIARLTHHK